LAVVKKLVERHQGEISVKSEVGKGTTFCFTISKELFH
jgi:signal transduction histidine kinase